MPLYDLKCRAGHTFTRFIPLRELEVPQLCECGEGAERQVSAPFVRGDLPPYRSPVTGEWVQGRAARRADLARSGCVEWEPGIGRHGAAQRAQSEDRLSAALMETFSRELAKLPSAARERVTNEMAQNEVVIERKGV